MGKGKQNKKGGGHEKGKENGNTKPPHVPEIPRTELYSIVENLKTHLSKLQKLENPKPPETDKNPKKGHALMKLLQHAPGRQKHENTSIGGVFSPSVIFDTYKKARKEISNKIHAKSSDSDVDKAQESMRKTEIDFIVDLGDQIKEVRENGGMKPVNEMAHYTKTLYGYLKLLMLAANRADLSPQDLYDKEVKALDCNDTGSYADVLKQDTVLILKFEAKKHSLLSAFDTEKAEALKLIATGVEGSDLAPKATLDKNEKEETNNFKIAQQKIWIENSPIEKMLACFQ